MTTALMILAAFATGSILFWSIRLGIGPVPTTKAVRTALADCLPGEVNGDIIELGCGWGQLLPLLQRRFPNHNLLAYERSPLPALFSGLTRGVAVKREDFFTGDFSRAGLVVCYLFPGAMERIEQEILPQLPDGCWIVTHTFRLPGRQPQQVVTASDLYQTPIYRYQKVCAACE